MELCFLDNIDSGRDTLVMTDWLSHRTEVGPIRGKPIMSSFYRSPLIISTTVLASMNLDPKVDASTVFCHLECHRTSTKFT
jgi:hypothetical protein